MASGDSGDSPSNAAIAAMEGGGGQWPGGILFIKYCWKAPFWSLIFPSYH